jgi:hypothetical protein
MSQHTSSASEKAEIGSKDASLSNRNTDMPTNFNQQNEVADTGMVFPKGSSEDKRAEWKQFFDELEIWHEKRYERLVEELKEVSPNIEPPPRKDKDWTLISYNHPWEILNGTEPPVPPGYGKVTREEVIEKERRRLKRLDSLEKESNGAQTELGQANQRPN